MKLTPELEARIKEIVDGAAKQKNRYGLDTAALMRVSNPESLKETAADMLAILEDIAAGETP